MRGRKSVFAMLTLLAFSATVSAQIDEAEMATALERVGELLGLPPVAPDELKREVAALGQLAFRSEVPINFMSRDQLTQYIRELFEDEYPEEFAAREERMLRGFGFLEAGEDLRSLREKVLNENVAGFYDERPGVKKLFAISSGNALNVMNQLILSHELRHAIQDQHVVIREKLEVESDYDDRRLAALCLFEGDASIMMQEYLSSRATKNRPEMANLFQIFSQSMTGQEVASMFAGPALRDAPPVVQEQLIAPYFEGPKLASIIFQRGGFEELSRMLHRPPRSMEQVLHPEKYLDDVDEPVEVELPEAMGQTPDFEGRLGELFIRILLRGSGSGSQADTAAAGWGGDSYAVLRNGGGYRLVWRTVWDTTSDAREFEAAMREYAVARFGEESTTLRRDGQSVLFERRGFQ
ncbi:MAG TPA: hypothetical protein VEK15_29990 [Vicinamibacteria bacterium]|nr:hypothetical protein [Vicinamibacteria bacterium]